MIAKATKGRGFRGVLSYVLSRDGAEIVATSMAASDARGLAREFGQVRRLRADVTRAVLHTAIALPPGETLADDQWREVVAEYLAGMGLRDHQYVAVLHRDTEHAHLHLIVSRIHPVTGQVASDSHDYRRQEVIMRRLEMRYGLRQVAPSIEAPRRAPKRGEIERAARTGEASIKTRLQQLCDAAARGATTLTQYVERLHAVGVDVILTLQQEDTRLTGIQYVLDDVVMKGSDLGKAYAAAGIQKRGVTYDKDRDAAAVRSSRERAQHRALVALDRGPALPAAADGRGLGAGDAAPGGVDGAASGRDAPDARRDAGGPARDAGRSLTGAPGADGGSEGAADGRRQHQEVEATSPKTHVADHHGSLAIGPGTDRLCDLAGLENRVAALTAQQVRQQLEGLACERYEIGIIPPKGAPGRPQQRLWTGEQVLKGLRWLRRMNALNNDICIRPAPRPDGQAEPLAFVDDLDATGLARVAADGHRWAALIESSPGRYHGWIRLAEQPLPRDVVTAAARDLAQRYGGDPASADWRHYGRLAGLTNRKPGRARPDGTAPFALLRSAWRGVTEAARRLLEAVQAALRPAVRPAAITPPAAARTAPAAVLATWRAVWARAAARTEDMSRRDAAACLGCLRAGHDPADVAAALLAASPDLATRHRDPADYARRTLAWAQQAQDARPAHDDTADAEDDYRPPGP